MKSSVFCHYYKLFPFFPNCFFIDYSFKSFFWLEKTNPKKNFGVAFSLRLDLFGFGRFCIFRADNLLKFSQK